MNRICLNKTTGRVIQMQTGEAPLGTLTQNAINAGYTAEEVEEKYVTPEECRTLIEASVTDEEKWVSVRHGRNQLLKDSDYIMFPDITITTEKKEEWETYRQSLRDIPQDYDSPDEVVYPDKPE